MLGPLGRQVLRVPLDGQEEAVISSLRPFDDAVLGPGHGPELGADLADGLVVGAVHLQLRGPDDASQSGTRLDAHPVVGPLAGFARAVGKGRGDVVGEVLVEASSQGTFPKWVTPARWRLSSLCLRARVARPPGASLFLVICHPVRIRTELPFHA